jgi:heme exporter protein C
MRTANRFVPFLLLVAAAMFIRAPYLIDAAPQESTMGLIQKIFYYHVPSAATAMLSAIVCGAASALYLWRRRPLADHVAVAAAELVVVFGAIALVTGPIWARKAWGVWWAWNEARLTITLVMWMIFIAYLLLRRFAGAGSDVLAAAVGLFGAVLVPFVYWSVNVWRGLHPKTTVVTTLQPEMMQPFLWCFAAFLVLYVGVLLVGVRLEMSRAAVERAWLALED